MPVKQIENTEKFDISTLNNCHFEVNEDIITFVLLALLFNDDLVGIPTFLPALLK